MSRTLVLGDVHGAYRALVQVLERANFNFEEDEKECVDLLLKVNKLHAICGNHDKWTLEWMRQGWKQPLWVNQGGEATLHSYGSSKWLPSTYDELAKIPAEHRAYFENLSYYYLDSENRLFVHGGIPWHHKQGFKRFVMEVSGEGLSWDRDLWTRACYEDVVWIEEGKRQRGEPKPQLTLYSEVFIGHTSTENYSFEPLNKCEIWNLDQGAGWNGKLTLMNVNTKEYWQSDFVPQLYPEVKGRGG
jgi:serine/threonine protein phosphatase 1